MTMRLNAGVHALDGDGTVVVWVHSSLDSLKTQRPAHIRLTQGCHAMPEGELYKLTHEESLRRHDHPHPRSALPLSTCMSVCPRVCLCVRETY